MLKQFNLFCLILSILMFSCKKSNSDKTELASLDLTNSYSMVIPKDSGSLSNTSSNNILYELTNSSSLSPLELINANGFNMNGYYSPEYFYQINDLYFLATFSVINSKPKVIESFIINYSDGKAFKLPEGFYPMKYNGSAWIQETCEKPIKEGPNNNFYFKGENRVFEIIASALDLFELQVIDIPGTSATNFNVDLQGEIMVGNIIYSSPTITYQSSVFTTENSYAASSFNNGFTLVKLTNNNILAFNIFLQNNTLIEDTVSVISGQGNNWQYIGTYKFINPNQIIFVFNQGMVRINEQGASVINLSTLTLSNILLADQSDTHIFLFAANASGNNTLIQITPSLTSPTITEILSPGRYLINHLNVLQNDDLTYQANRLDNNTKVFGFYSPATSYFNEVLNYQNITASQLITIK